METRVAKHRSSSKSPEKLAGGVLLGAVASGLATAALSSAGTANANCASISGVGNGPGQGGGSCTSAPGSFAIGIGPNTTANATGIFDGAFAYGLDNGATDATEADANGGVLSFAFASGKNVKAVTFGSAELAVAQGTGASAANQVLAQAGSDPGDFGNFALNLGGASTGTSKNIVYAGGLPGTPGFGNIATNFGGSASAARGSIVQAVGTGNGAFNLGGNANWVSVGNSPVSTLTTAQTGGVAPGTASTFGSAFSSLGQNNTVTSLGPLGIAGAFAINDHNVANANPIVQPGPGVNIKTAVNP
jgi:hypothetical protein